MTKEGNRFLRIIDSINEWSGKSVAWLFIPLALVMTFEVASRYLFNRPTIWAWDINVMLSTLLVIFAAGYTLLHDGHVKVDVLVIHLSPRKRAILNMVMSALFFLSIGALVYFGWTRGLKSIDALEYRQSILNPPIYWLRMCVPVAAFFLFLQGTAKFIRDFAIARSGGEQA